MNKRSQITLYSLGTIVFTFLLIFLVFFMAQNVSAPSFNLNDTREIGYEFLDDGKVVHIWNTQNDE